MSVPYLNVSNIIHPVFLPDINLPTVTSIEPLQTDYVPIFDVSKTIITRTFVNKIYKLYKSGSVDNIVVNLSNKVLSPSDKTVLSKGLTFCPTEGEPDFGQLWDDLKIFFRRLRITHFFSSDPNSKGNTYADDTYIALEDDRTEHEKLIDMKFKNKGKWEPPQGDHALETFIQSVTNDFGKMTPRTPHNKNLTKSETTSLKNLSEDQSIVIKKADKGAAVVLMNKEDYITESERQLSDQNFYIETNDDLTEKHSMEITSFLDQMLTNDEITTKVHEYLAPFESKTANFYFLPKIHKTTITGRPIISGNGCPTEAISSFVDEHIKPFVPLLPSYIRDTTDFIKKIESIELPDQCLLVTMDVTSLYTNIPNQGGMVAIYETLKDNNYCERASIKSLLELLKLVLHKNNFDFNGKHYLQIGGTAMGTKLAP